VYLFRMKGTINAQTLPEYRKIIDELMTKLDVPHKDNIVFIMDYGGIEDVDSSALANIIDRLKNDVRCDHRVMFINVPEKFKELVALFKIGDTIEIYNTQEDAERAL
ncbi:MAG TPA: STAS domain-containing protein, partial [Candidatus Omnitrophota bacterium]|nr:STAS domain-containing protein [Candidatus Omnitrophota bacterium]